MNPGACVLTLKERTRAFRIAEIVRGLWGQPFVGGAYELPLRQHENVGLQAERCIWGCGFKHTFSVET